MKIEIKKIGNSTGLILPKELLAKLQLKQGDSLFVTELAEGGLKLARHDPNFEQTAWRSPTRPWGRIATRSVTWRSDRADLAHRRPDCCPSHPRRAIARSSAAPPGLRDRGLLIGPRSGPSTNMALRVLRGRTGGGLLLGLACNHAFVDGNKRIAFFAMVAFLGSQRTASLSSRIKRRLPPCSAWLQAR